LRVLGAEFHQLDVSPSASTKAVSAAEADYSVKICTLIPFSRYLASIPKNKHRRLLHVVHHGLELLLVGLRIGHSRAGFRDGFEETERIPLFTDPGEVVIDPCAGSGSTIIAASRCDRTGFGFEIKKDFHKAACDWLKREKSQMKLML
jgi:hypothetical protein